MCGKPLPSDLTFSSRNNIVVEILLALVIDRTGLKIPALSIAPP